ncbi:hypothetical protein E1A91_A01G134100v1 [Gossypium mustelinum]|uniref:HTH CENPB-type domain-containing protein n=1 Tax=Gossypium mustelinum TaxID=34275 RepID=A0A5D3AFC1_GOSMU|nr:hypothetical protein E1A91_A01G134100v1 [Gossypium mustelinum]
MASHLKGVKKSTLTDEMKKSIIQKDLQQWVQQTFDLSFSQSIISHTPKKHKSTKYPKLEKVLHEWFLLYQEKVSMTGEMIQTKTKEFKARRGIKSYRIFDTLPQIRAKLESFDWKDIYNMDETILFYRLQADHSLATKQLEGRKKDKERLIVVVCYNGNGSDKVSLWVIGNILEDYEKGEINPEKINVLDAIHFINATWNIDVKPTIIANCFRHCKIRFEEDMPLEQEIGDVEGIHKLKETLNYPSETESLIESSMDEEIIQGVMDVSADDEQDLDDSSVLPHVSPKKAFLAVDTLKNYLIQHDKNIPDLIYALLKFKDEIVFDLHAKKKQLTIYTYFSKE